MPSVIYPGYSADFYDGKHFVVVRLCLIVFLVLHSSTPGKLLI